MLQSLHVHNFALIEDAKIDFAPGFNIFTGETGAGKSILIDAFGVVLGDRASADYIRSGADSFWVQAVFDISGIEAVKSLLAKHGIPMDKTYFAGRAGDRRRGRTVFEAAYFSQRQKPGYS